MKRTCFLIVLTLLMAFSSLPVSAKEENVASIVADYEVKDNGNVVITASLVDIKDSAGLWGIVYNIRFDHTVLEYVNANVNMPSKWESFVDSEEAEVFSYLDPEESGLYIWSVFCVRQGYGIKEDNEFKIEIEFKPLKKSNTNVTFESDGVYSDDEAIEADSLKAETKKVSIVLSDKNNDNNSSSESSRPSGDNSSPNNNSSADNSTSAENSMTVENSGSSDESSQNGNVSGGNISSEIIDESNDALQTEASENADDSDISIEGSSGDASSISDSEGDDSSTDIVNESGTDSDDDESNENNILWVIIIIGFAAIGGGVAFVVFKMKKGN